MTGPLNSERHLQQENLRLRQDNEGLRQEVKRLNVVLDMLRELQETSIRINAQTNVLQLLDSILESALRSIEAQDGSLMLVDEEADELVFVVVHGSVRRKLPGHRIPIGLGIAGWVAQHQREVIIPNVYIDPRFSPEVDRLFQFRTRSLLCVPVSYDSKVLGIIQAINKSDDREFKRDDLTLLAIVAQLAAVAMHKAESVPAN